MDIIGNEYSLVVKKISSFPYSKYHILDKSKEESCFEVSSNFIGSKYNLRKEGITYLTMVFNVGCASKCRSYTIYSLRDHSKWK